MTQRPETQRKPNDDLLIMTHDGDIYLDQNVRQEMGYLLSDVNQWALPLPRPSGYYTFSRPHQQPTKEKSVFIYRSDPPSPGSYEDSAMLMNRGLDAVHSLAERGKWKKYESFIQRANNWKYLICLVVTVVFCWFAHQAWEEAKEQRAHERMIEETRTTLENQPTGSGFTDEQIMELIERQSAPSRGESRGNNQ